MAVGDRVVAARADGGALLADAHRPSSGARRRTRRSRRNGAGAAAPASRSAAGGERRSRPRAPSLLEEARQPGVQFLPHGVGESIGGIDEDEIESGAASSSARCASQRPASARTSSTRSPRPRLSTLPSAGRVSRSTRTPARRPARAPRSPARRCRSRGRGRVRPRPPARDEKIASRTRSEVGRTFQPRGASSGRPLNSPAMQSRHPFELRRVPGVRAPVRAVLRRGVRQPLDRFNSSIGIPRTDVFFGTGDAPRRAGPARATLPGEADDPLRPDVPGRRDHRARSPEELDLGRSGARRGPRRAPAAAPLRSRGAADRPAGVARLRHRRVRLPGHQRADARQRRPRHRHSSAIYEYSLLGRPMAFFAPDHEAYEAERGFYFDFRTAFRAPCRDDRRPRGASCGRASSTSTACRGSAPRRSTSRTATRPSASSTGSSSRPFADRAVPFGPADAPGVIGAPSEQDTPSHDAPSQTGRAPSRPRRMGSR